MKRCCSAARAGFGAASLERTWSGWCRWGNRSAEGHSRWIIGNNHSSIHTRRRSGNGPLPVSLQKTGFFIRNNGFSSRLRMDTVFPRSSFIVHTSLPCGSMQGQGMNPQLQFISVFIYHLYMSPEPGFRFPGLFALYKNSTEWYGFLDRLSLSMASDWEPWRFPADVHPFLWPVFITLGLSWMAVRNAGEAQWHTFCSNIMQKLLGILPISLRTGRSLRTSSSCRRLF